MTPTPSAAAADDRALVLLARNGDRDAFGELVCRHQRRVWLVCRQYVGPDEAEAAAQDSLVKAFTALGTFDGRAAFTTWLTRIAINTCLDSLRRRKREGVRLADDAAAEAAVGRVADLAVDPEARAQQRQTVARLAAAETGLPERQREIFRLRFYAEMELDEIAAALEVHVGTVKTQLHRAVHRLRRELGDLR
ncbi:MAG TPA: sigma-70 family RNA polymerase sigma factor [Methylomirabilota bacterium]|nr:sigma-70 family RNA polymerase sigma factor [Methylomirabilota bacterium]